MACGPESIILERLEENVSQKPAFRGAEVTGFLMQVVKNDEGDWLIMITNPKTGLGCVALYGEGFEAIPEPVTPPEERRS